MQSILLKTILCLASILCVARGSSDCYRSNQIEVKTPDMHKEVVFQTPAVMIKGLAILVEELMCEPADHFFVCNLRCFDEWSEAQVTQTVRHLSYNLSLITRVKQFGTEFYAYDEGVLRAISLDEIKQTWGVTEVNSPSDFQGSLMLSGKALKPETFEGKHFLCPDANLDHNIYQQGAKLLHKLDSMKSHLNEWHYAGSRKKRSMSSRVHAIEKVISQFSNVSHHNVVTLKNVVSRIQQSLKNIQEFDYRAMPILMSLTLQGQAAQYYKKMSTMWQRLEMEVNDAFDQVELARRLIQLLELAKFEKRPYICDDIIHKAVGTLCLDTAKTLLLGSQKNSVTILGEGFNLKVQEVTITTCQPIVDEEGVLTINVNHHLQGELLKDNQFTNRKVTEADALYHDEEGAIFLLLQGAQIGLSCFPKRSLSWDHKPYQCALESPEFRDPPVHGINLHTGLPLITGHQANFTVGSHLLSVSSLARKIALKIPDIGPVKGDLWWISNRWMDRVKQHHFNTTTIIIVGVLTLITIAYLLYCINRCTNICSVCLNLCRRRNLEITRSDTQDPYNTIFRRWAHEPDIQLQEAAQNVGSA